MSCLTDETLSTDSAPAKLGPALGGHSLITLLWTILMNAKAAIEGSFDTWAARLGFFFSAVTCEEGTLQAYVSIDDTALKEKRCQVVIDWYLVSFTALSCFGILVGILKLIKLIRLILWKRVNWSKIKASIPRTVLSDVVGVVAYDTLGPYVQVPDLPGKRIRLDPADWSTAKLPGAYAAGVIRKGNEAVIANNPIYPVSCFPSQMVVLSSSRSEDDCLGMGTRVKVENGVSCLYTAAHVATQMQRSADPHMIAHGKAYPVDRKWLVQSYSPEDDFDVIGIEVPDNVWSYLGVTVATVNRRPPEDNAASCFGFDGTLTSSSVGPAKADGMTVRHWASTKAGWSGSPLFSKGKVFAIHSGYGAGAECNRAVLLQPFLSVSETRDRESALRRLDMIEENYDEYRVVVGGRSKNMRYSRSGGAYSMSDSDWVPASGRYWADMVDDDESESEVFDGTQATRSLMRAHARGYETKLASNNRIPGRKGVAAPHGDVGKGLGERSLETSASISPYEIGRRCADEFAARRLSEVSLRNQGDKQGKDKAPIQTVGASRNSQFSESTSGTVNPRSGAEGGKNADQPDASSHLSAKPSDVPSGKSARASRGRREGQKQKNKASSAKQTDSGQAEKPVSDRSAADVQPSNTDLSLKNLQARVDSMRATLSKLPISSQSGAEANALMRDLLSYAMRCESKKR